MAQTVIEHVYHLKGGAQLALEHENPLLDRREPVVVFCQDGIVRLKIGDGQTRYNDLPYVGGDDRGNIQIVVDDHLDIESSNPVMNKVITQELYNKVSVQPGKRLSTNDYTEADRRKLLGIEAGATKTIVDIEALDKDSNNPVANWIVAQAIENVTKRIETVGTRIEDVETTVSDKVSEAVEQQLKSSDAILDGGEL